MWEVDANTGASGRGGVAENTTFYVFSQGKDGASEAFPISDWYNFTPVQRYETLDADEAEKRKPSGFVC